MPIGDHPEGVVLSHPKPYQEVMLEVNRNKVYAAIYYIDTHPNLPEDQAVDIILDSIGLFGEDGK